MVRAFLIVWLLQHSALVFGSPDPSPLVERPVVASHAVDLKKRFQHERHSAVFKKQGLNCTSCHVASALKSSRPSVQEYDSAKGFANAYARSSCHYCHYAKDNKDHNAAAPKSCTLCHDQVDKPSNHGLPGWREDHSTHAKFAPRTCDTCHSKAFCADCHLSRDALKRDMHGRNFVFTHSIAARAAPQKCSRCHTASTCVDCHAKRGK